MERCCHARCAVAAAAAGAPSRRRSRHSDPPRPSGTTAWPSADHSASESVSQRPPEGLPNPPVHLSVPPRNPKSARQRRFPAPLAPPGPPRRRPAWTRNRRPRVRSSGCCSEPTTAASRRAAGRVRASSGSMSTAAPPISAFGPLHGRQAPPPGRQPTTRRQSRSHSGPLRAFQTRRCTSAYPRRKSEKCPSTPFPSAADSARSATPAPVP